MIIRKLQILSVFLFLSAFSLCMADGGKPVRVEKWDSTAVPEKKVWLRARLVASGFLGFPISVDNVAVTFKHRNSLIGNTVTNDRGVASVLYEAPAEKGFVEYTIEFNGSQKYASVRETGRLYVYDPDDPVLLVKADRITADIKDPDDLPEFDPEDIYPLDYSSMTLGILEQDYNILYLTEKDKKFIDALHEWMRIRVFPLAPIVNRKKGLHPLAENAEKDIFEALKKMNLKAEAGISDKRKDVKRFLDDNMKAVWFSRDSEKEAPDGAMKAENWKTVTELLRN